MEQNNKDYIKIIENLPILKYNFSYKNEIVFYYVRNYKNIFVRFFIEKNNEPFGIEKNIAYCIAKQTKSGWKIDVFVKKDENEIIKYFNDFLKKKNYEKNIITDINNEILDIDFTKYVYISKTQKSDLYK